jgi:porin
LGSPHDDLGFSDFLSSQALVQQDKKTDDPKPADPDRGASMIQETTLGILPNPLEKRRQRDRAR